MQITQDTTLEEVSAIFGHPASRAPAAERDARLGCEVERGAVCAGLPAAEHSQDCQSAKSAWTRAAPDHCARRRPSNQSGSSIAAIVERAFPSNRLLTKMNVLRFGPVAFPSSISALPAARASGFSSLMVS
jgi:hypothetical protein